MKARLPVLVSVIRETAPTRLNVRWQLLSGAELRLRRTTEQLDNNKLNWKVSPSGDRSKHGILIKGLVEKTGIIIHVIRKNMKSKVFIDEYEDSTHRYNNPTLLYGS